MTDARNNRPQQQHSDDAGCDLRSVRAEEIPTGWTVLAGTGYHPRPGDIPPHSVGLVFARSSLHKEGLSLANGVGVIDSGYRGEVRLALRNDTDAPVVIAKGQRIAQIVVIPLDMSSALYAADSYRNTQDRNPHNNAQQQQPRGQKGFGSTGRD